MLPNNMSSRPSGLLFISSTMLEIKQDPFGMTWECCLPNALPIVRECWIEKGFFQNDVKLL
jgi:hypothetical protein